MSVREYFNPQLIKTFSSKFNTKIQLINFYGHLRLDMGDLTQSGQVIEKIWSKAFSKLLSSNYKPKKILILGFGAGSAARVIKKKYPHADIIGVEIDPVVIWIARTYFKVDEISNLEIINKNAEQFVKSTKDRFDLTLIDCYQGYKIPPALENIQFLTLLKNKSDVVLINRLFWENHKQMTLEFLCKLNKTFITDTCRTPSNLIIKYNNHDAPNTKRSF